MRLYDTVTRSVEPLELREPGKVGMYVCGPTVYGPAHLGHARMALVFDVLRRYLEWSGLEVTFVSNITDIEDKIIALANSQGRSEAEVAGEWEAAWYSTMDALGVARPDSDPHATDYVDAMATLISELVANDHAYVTSDGVYLEVEKVPDYGLLAHQSLDEMLAGGGDRQIIGEEKRNPADFALWKFAKEGEPSWPAEFGAGRPGWHTECVVMSLDLLGDGFDLHGGGIDLAFPHHENERAQAVAVGRPFSQRWVHNGFVEVGGEKMSKSLGNFTTVDDLIERHDPRALRLLILQAHYRSPVEVTPTSMGNAEAALERLDTLARRVSGLADSEPDGERLGAFRERMDDDLDTPGAMAVLFATVTEANRALDSGDESAAAGLVAAWRAMLAAVGLPVEGDGADLPEDVLELCRRRDQARADKDWGSADSIRDELVVLGYVVEDTPSGTAVRPS
ncbi:MAG: cysteine--tRNA ligase [Actinomycetia bacterium]|nr:cysteine--tRNA ligase [Actinomycetes bacterium]